MRLPAFNAREVGRFGIRVNSVKPHRVLDANGGLAGTTRPIREPGTGVRIPSGAFCATVEVAAAGCVPAQCAASMFSGVCLPVDGGTPAARRFPTARRWSTLSVACAGLAGVVRRRPRHCCRQGRSRAATQAHGHAKDIGEGQAVDCRRCVRLLSWGECCACAKARRAPRGNQLVENHVRVRRRVAAWSVEGMQVSGI